MKTSHQILKMSERDLRRLVARQQVEKAETDADWARGCVPPQEWPAWDEALADAKRVKREVYAATKVQPSNAIPPVPDDWEYLSGILVRSPSGCTVRLDSDGLPVDLLMSQWKPDMSDGFDPIARCVMTGACTVVECLGGTLGHATNAYEDYLKVKDSRTPCHVCQAAGRPIADGTEKHATEVARMFEHFVDPANLSPAQLRRARNEWKDST